MVYEPNVYCPVEFDFNVTFQTRDGSAGICTQLLPILNHIHVPVPCNGYNMQSISHACWETAYDVLAIIHSEGKECVYAH